jgi:hypothetical protein
MASKMAKTAIGKYIKDSKEYKDLMKFIRDTDKETTKRNAKEKAKSKKRR